jgi:hypothetical protein
MKRETPSDGRTGSPSVSNDLAKYGLDRRTFLSLSAATGGALALPGTASADVTGDPMTDEYAFVLNHTPEEYEAATVIEFVDSDALATFAEEYEEASSDLERVPKAVTRETPTPAAHAHLTADEVEDVLEPQGGRAAGVLARREPVVDTRGTLR